MKIQKKFLMQEVCIKISIFQMYRIADEKIILIPTRINSKRLPAKALLKIEDIPIITHTLIKELVCQNLQMKFMYALTLLK